MDAKERKKREKMERREAEKKEMQYYREQLAQLANGSDARGQLSFPPTLQKGQRKKLHNIAASLGLKSKSHGKGDNRFLTVFKKNVVPYTPTGDGSINYLRLTNNSIDKLLELTNHDPVSDAEKEITIVRRPTDTTKNHAHLPFMFGDGRSKTKVTVPPPMINGAEKYRATRQSLPIFEYRDGIIDAINQNQVVVISGETGSGKTTQVPQYIMEDFASRGQECRIICTQPRRLAATSIATRVSTERNDTIGRSVGYQIRLDSRISADTNLIFTTSGFLLRCLTGSKQEDVYKSITHLVLDEVHEREKVTDFLLIAIRDAIKTNPHLKVILMSATLDSDQFSKYFENCPVINVPGRMFDVEIMHLGEVLVSTKYKSKEMHTYMTDNPLPKILRTSKNMDTIKEADEDNEKLKISDEDIQFYDECFDECMSQDDDDASFEQIFCLITDENMPVDYMHSTKLRTALGIAAEKGFLNVLTKLLGLGAKPTFKDAHGKCALDYAEENEQEECCEVLAYYQTIAPITATTIAAAAIESDSDAEAKAWQQFTQLAYQMTDSKRDAIDHELLYHVIYHIHTEKSTDGSILVFLPGYEDIMDQKEKIENRFNMQNYQLFVLHSGVNGTSNSEQSRVFDHMPKGIRKIILSTNIAETSLTINDVVYVVDAGKVKQLSYDSISESTCLTSTNISQACAKQRAGRAGRIQCGFCYRLYPLEQYETMEKYTLPEILRVPLQEICLNTKILAGDLSIEEFLLKALQPPSATNIRQSIELLKKVNALDADENITYLGIHLANMPVDCQLGKMILYAIVLRCLDPVVTIVSALSVKDPFMLPLGNEGEKINQIKKEFARNSLSDHQMLLNTFDEWSKKKTRLQFDFCHENYISQGNMQMIQGVRRLIMGHLTMAGFVCEGTARNISKLNQNSMRWDVVRACLTAGMYPNVCRISPIVGQLISKQDKKLVPHLSSVLRERKGRFQLDRMVKSAGAEWFIHGEKSRISNNSFVRNITIVPSIVVALFTGPIMLSDSCLIASGESKAEVLSDMDCDDIPQEDDIENTDFDDQLFGCGGIEEEGETIFNIDDWISFIVDEFEATLLLQLRQKFASIFVKFLRNPVEFQMTNKEQTTLNVLLEVLKEEDDIAKYLKEQAAKAAAEKTKDDNDGEGECFGSMTKKSSGSIPKNDRKPIPERPTAGPAYISPAYNQAIEPEGRRNKKKNKKKKANKWLDKRYQADGLNWRNCDVVSDDQTQGVQPSTSTQSSISSAENQQKKLTQGLFNKLDQPFTPPSLQLPPPSFQFPPPSLQFPQGPGMFNMAMIPPMNHSIQNRYFLLVVSNVGVIYQSVYSSQWKFKTPRAFIAKQARESYPAKIILFWHVPKKHAIFGYGEFQTRGQGGYVINVDDNIRNFRPLMSFDANDDYEMAPDEGNEVLQFCKSVANIKRS